MLAGEMILIYAVIRIFSFSCSADKYNIEHRATVHPIIPPNNIRPWISWRGELTTEYMSITGNGDVVSILSPEAGERESRISRAYETRRNTGNRKMEILSLCDGLAGSSVFGEFR